MVAILIPTLPLIAFFLVALLVFLFEKPNQPPKINKHIYSGITIFSIFVSMILSFVMFFDQLGKEPKVVNLYSWTNLVPINIGFLYDNLSIFVLLMVTVVVLMIQIYSTGYMEKDRDYPRFFAYLSLFTSGMLITVLSSSLITLIIGWELMGLCSYLLIGFWYHKDSAAKAAKKAFWITRLGDLGLLLTLFILISHGISLDILELNKYFSQVELIKGLLVLVPIGIMISAFGKSAQFPLHVWLPDAMEGPTPVSALIHAATMVAAGVYFIARLYPMFYNTEILGVKLVVIVGLIGAISAFIAATMGLVNRDIKRILAYSTMSQLGYMFMALSGAGAGMVAAIFHLITHGFFKALLFMSAGNIITAIERAHHNHDHHIDPNDIWLMNNIKKSMKQTFWLFLIGTLALIGLFPMSGFFSKDEILISVYKEYPFFFALGFITVLLTSFYMGRIIWVAFVKEKSQKELETVEIDYNIAKEINSNLKEVPPNMIVPLWILAILSTIGGVINLPFDFILPKHFMGHYLEEIYNNIPFQYFKFNIYLAIGSTIMIIAGLAIGYILYIINSNRKIPSIFGLVYRLLDRRYYIDDAYELFYKNIVKPLSTYTSLVDNKVIVSFIVYLAIVFQKISIQTRKLLNGLFYHYYSWITLGIIIGIISLMWKK
ncbi:MAG: NADH-quinone oxidoreductase subunit L [Candidatus Calescibacterium sp.]|nr:NADH-quinone oxidoreductase subunit L [Candidatus Calescibacterium sp.]MCX7971897.1 NADH-quinone oxidoreductase subunit L [bacterium]MDW8195004.1 NADH-quinone oxidoreductase subunit L [Candidatus Calescibacterium sp.]